MPFQLHCPTCNRLLHVPDHLAGNRLRCPGCHSTVEAIVPATLATPASQAAAPAGPFPDTDDAFDVFRRPARSEFDWKGFDIGLLVSLLATIVVGVVVLLVAILEIVDSPGLDSVYYQILHYALLLGLIVLAISFFISSSIPATVGERPMILASFMFITGGAGCLWLERFCSFFDYFDSLRVQVSLNLFMWAGVIACIAGLLFWFHVLRSIAMYHANTLLIRSTFAFLVYAAAIVPAYVLVMALVLLSIPDRQLVRGAETGLVLEFTGFVLAAGFFGWLSANLWLLHGLIRRSSRARDDLDPR